MNLKKKYLPQKNHQSSITVLKGIMYNMELSLSENT